MHGAVLLFNENTSMLTISTEGLGLANSVMKNFSMDGGTERLLVSGPRQTIFDLGSFGVRGSPLLSNQSRTCVP